MSLFVDDIREPDASRFDWSGFALSGIAMSGLMFGLETAGRGVVAAAADPGHARRSGVAAMLLYILHARRHPAPLIDFTLLRYRTFLVSVAAGTMFRIGIGAMPVPAADDAAAQLRAERRCRAG